MKKIVKFNNQGIGKCEFELNDKYDYFEYKIEPLNINLMLSIYINGRLIGGTWEHENRISTYNSSKWFNNCQDVGKLEFQIELMRGDINQELEVSINVKKARTGYYKVDTHVHTTESDGQIAPHQIGEEMQRFGFEAIFVTDHNTTSQNYITKTKNPIAIFPGMEITSRNGHINILGISPTNKINLDNAKELYNSLEAVKSEGALVQLNHPYDDTCHCCSFNWDFEDLAIFDVIEIWNYSWFSELKNYKSCNLRTLELWQSQLVSGKKIFASCGTDYHEPNEDDMYGNPRESFYPILNVYSESREREDIMVAIKNGNSYITKHGENIMFESSLPFGSKCTKDDMVYIKQVNKGDVLKIITEDECNTFTLEKDIDISLNEYLHSKFVRFEVWRINGDLKYPIAFTNPLFPRV